MCEVYPGIYIYFLYIVSICLVLQLNIIIIFMAPKSVKRIKDWRFIFGDNTFDVFIEGHLESDPSKKLWRSSKVVGIESSKIILTESGTKYCLIGSINKNACIDKRFPFHIVSAFTDGFPKNWRELLSSFRKELMTKSAERSSTNVHNFDSGFGSPQSRPKKQAKAVKPYKSTPDTVYSTRSGRIVKPSVAKWSTEYSDDFNETFELRNSKTDFRMPKQVKEESSAPLTSAKRKSIGKKTAPPSSYDDSESEDSIDAESSDGIDTFGPICKPLKNVAKQFQKNRLKAIESSIEEEEKDARKIGRPPKADLEPITKIGPPLKRQSKGNLNKSGVIAIDAKTSDAIDTIPPIHPPQKATKQLPKRMNNLESSYEEEKIIEKGNRKRGRQQTAKNENAPPPKRQSMENLDESVIILNSEPFVQFPESDSEIEIIKEKPEKKLWMPREKENFMKLLNAMNPISEQDWENIALSQSGIERSVKELKAMAEKEKWKPRKFAEEKNNVGNNIANISLSGIPSSSTAAHIIQPVRHNNNKQSNKAQIPTLISTALSPISFTDSLLSCIRTPVNPIKPQFAMNPTVLLDFNDTPSDLSESNSLIHSSTSSSLIESDERSKIRQQICNLKILKNSRSFQMKPSQSSPIFSDTTNSTPSNFLAPQPSHQFLGGFEEGFYEDEFEDSESMMDN